MSEYRAGNVKHAGEWFKFRVDDDGNWLAEVDGRDLKHPTRAALLKDIERVMRLKKKLVNIPITVVESKANGYIKLKHGVVTGIHAGTGNLMVSWDIGGTGQLTIGYTSEDVLRRLTPGEEDELARATKEAAEASDYLRNYTSQRRLYKGTKGLADQIQAELAKGEK